MHDQANDKQGLIFLKTFITPMGKKAQIRLFLKLNGCSGSRPRFSNLQWTLAMLKLTAP
jgi:hypothetical protein